MALDDLTLHTPRRVEGYTFKETKTGFEVVVSIGQTFYYCQLTPCIPEQLHGHPSALTAIMRSADSMTLVDLIPFMGFKSKLFPFLLKGSAEQVADTILSLSLICENTVKLAASKDHKGRRPLLFALDSLSKALYEASSECDSLAVRYVQLLLQHTATGVSRINVPSP